MKPYLLLPLAGIILASSSNALAQDAANDPFAAYDGGAVKAPEPEPEPPAPAAPTTVLVKVVPPEQGTAAPEKEVVTNPLTEKQDTAVVVEDIVTMDKLLEPYRFSVGGGATLSFDYGSTDLYNGGSRDSSAFHARLYVEAGMTVFQNITVELTAGTMWRRIARGEKEEVFEHDWVFTARGWYSYPVWARAALLGGIGLGGYFGSSSVPYTTNNITIDAKTNTGGFVGDLYAGVGYILADAWQLRVLGNFNFLIGNETLKNQDVSLGASTTHVGLTLGVTYTF